MFWFLFVCGLGEHAGLRGLFSLLVFTFCCVRVWRCRCSHRLWLSGCFLWACRVVCYFFEVVLCFLLFVILGIGVFLFCALDVCCYL